MSCGVANVMNVQTQVLFSSFQAQTLHVRSAFGAESTAYQLQTCCVSPVFEHCDSQSDNWTAAGSTTTDVFVCLSLSAWFVTEITDSTPT